MNVKLKRTLPLIFAAVISFFVCACSAVDEPVEKNSAQRPKTRSVQSETISESEAVEYAKEALLLDAASSVMYSVEEITAKTDEGKKIFPSETIAYVVTFGDNGSVLVANDSRDNPVLLLRKSGKFKVTNGSFDDKFIKDLEGFLMRIKNQKDRDAAIAREHGHWMCGTHISTGVTIDAPFNADVLKNHPNCDAGTVPGNCAVMVSYTQNVFRFNKCEYNFPSIDFCLKQGPGYFPPYMPNSIFDPSGDYYLTFVNSYDGSVEAMSRLISDFGNAMYTSYNNKNSTTYISDARRALENAGCEVSQLYDRFSLQGIWDLLYNGYIVLQEGYDLETREKISFLFTGGENIYENNPSITDGFSVWCYQVDNGKFPLAGGILYSSEIIDGCVWGYDLRQYFGVKIQEDAFRDEYSHYHF